MVSVDALRILAAFERVLGATEDAQAELDELDAVVGDGDHGVTMVLGWRSVVSRLVGEPPSSPGGALRTAAEAFADVGGSAGPLWGTALLRAGRALGDVPDVGVSELGDAADAAVHGMCDRGRCAEGDGTVVDAMGPAARALASQLDLKGGLAAAAAAAAEGAAATALRQPRRGRAARAPERARGHVDAGAHAAAVFWAAVAGC